MNRRIPDRYRELILYLFFGGLTTVVSIGSFAILIRVFHMDALAANVVSWILAVSFAYVTNRTWVFSSDRRDPSGIMKEILAFFGGRIGTLLMEEAILYVGISLLGIDAILVKTAAQAAVVIGNYVISKWLVF